MASRPATAEDMLPNARRIEPARVTVPRYQAQIKVSRPLADGSTWLEYLSCDHLHTTPEAADECADAMARRAQREALAAFTPCACHDATPSQACTEHPEPLYYWCADDDPRAVDEATPRDVARSEGMDWRYRSADGTPDEEA